MAESVKQVFLKAGIKHESLLKNNKAFKLHVKTWRNKNKIILFVVEGGYKMFIYGEDNSIKKSVDFKSVNDIPSNYTYLTKVNKLIN